MNTEANQPDKPADQPVEGQLAIQDDAEDGPRVIAVDVPEPRIVAVEDDEDEDGDEAKTGADGMPATDDGEDEGESSPDDPKLIPTSN